MSNKFTIVLLTLYMFVGTFPVVSQTTTNSDSTIRRIPDVKMETVKGKHIQLGKTQSKVYILFLLSKPSSMAKGKKRLKDVRLWMKSLRKRYNRCVYSMLIVEPFKTSFPFYNIQKGKLKNESFPVIVDKKGKILEEFGIRRSSELSVIVTDGSVTTMKPFSGKFSEESKKKVTDEVDKLILKFNEGPECSNS